MSSPSVAPGPPRDIAAARRLRALAALGAAALLLHAALLGELEWGWPAGPPRRAAMSVRTLAPARAPQADPAVPKGEAAPAPATRAGRPAPAPHARGSSVGSAVVPTMDPHLPAPGAVAGPAAERDGAPVAGAEPRPAEAEPVATAIAARPSDAEPIPLYATRPPAPVVAIYAMRRGAASGSAELRWDSGADGYALRLEGRIGGAVVVSQASEGAFDASGLAPSRFTDWRLRGRRLATNFRREAGTISYSGSTEEHPLASGAQDRLSWLLQLAAIVAAEPGRRIPGASVVMAVAGVRGAPDVWAFRCEGADGAGAALRFVRESRGLYDSRVEVWLDAARGFLPIRLSMTNGVEAQAFELALEAVGPESRSGPAGAAPEPALAFRPDGPK